LLRNVVDRRRCGHGRSDREGRVARPRHRGEGAGGEIEQARGAVLPMERTAAARLANMLVSRSTTQAESVQVVLVNSESVELPSVRADPGCSRDFGRISAMSRSIDRSGCDQCRERLRVIV
jgi:hypothetical protein